jgi:hypothetical protein
MTYLIGVAGIAPHRGLLFISAGLVLTTIVGDRINKHFLSKQLLDFSHKQTIS